MLENNMYCDLNLKIKKAWPGKVEISYFIFTKCWDIFRTFETSSITFKESGRIQ